MARLPAAARFVLTASVLVTATAAALCAQISHPVVADISGAAQVVVLDGQVSVMLDSKTVWALNVGDYVKPGQVIVTGSNGSGMFKVGDGSTFEVFPGSKVVFRANRGNWDELLELMLGKIKVQIEHLGGVPNNNKVRTPTAVISVRGTTFDVEYDGEKEATMVLDEEGSVEVARLTRLDDKKILNANETVTVYKNASLAKKFDTGGLLKRIYQAAMDAISQQEINQRTGAPSTPAPTTGPSVPSTNPGDHNSTNTPTPPPPPPPPPPQ